MIDQVKIYVRSGGGGSGCDSFKGARFTRSRRPDGGNGGRGGDVIIKVDSNIRSLEKLKFNQHFRAENGKVGQSNKKKGADARPCVIKVPCGTIIRDLENDLLLRDLIEPEAELAVARGGQPGKGNTRNALATAGLPAEEKHLSLELKFVADVALVGYPNCGKSTLLSKISSARPKIAAYPFTTTSPYLATLQFSDFEQPDSLAIVEIPGLIKGSGQGKGLGAQFLRHAERAKVFIHLIDMAAQEARDPFEDFQALNHELKLYNQALLDKPQILVANKMELPEAKVNLKKFTAQLRQRVYPVSALEAEGHEELLDVLKKYFQRGLSDGEEVTA